MKWLQALQFTGVAQCRNDRRTLRLQIALTKLVLLARALPYGHTAADTCHHSQGSFAMQTRNRLFDDAAKIAGGAVGTLAGAKREIEALVRQQLERMLSSLDLVTRDEFDAVKEMAVKARSEQEDLAERLTALEANTAPKKPATPKSKSKPPEKSPDNR